MSRPESRTTSSDRPRAVSLATAAEWLSVSTRTLHRLIASGDFPAPIKVGSSTRVLVADLDRFIERQRSRSTT